jgi:microsomal epoxide hydrolase
MSPQPRRFTLQVADAAIADLRARLARTRFPDQAPGPPWAYGTDVGWVRELVGYWQERFDWRAQEVLLNALPQYTVPLAGIDLHFVHAPGHGPNPCPLLLSHGWPGSVFEFLELIPLLTDPARFGGDPAMPSPSSRPPCRASVCRSRPASRASPSRRSPTAWPR